MYEFNSNFETHYGPMIVFTLLVHFFMYRKGPNSVTIKNEFCFEFREIVVSGLLIILILCGLYSVPRMPHYCWSELLFLG